MPSERTPQTGLAAPHEAVQVPHVAGVARSASQPLVPTASQSASPGAHRSTSHVPSSHEVSVIGTEHALPHAPQSVVVVSDRSHPFAALPSQSPHAVLHAPTPHALALHTPAALSRRQGALHAPQFSMSVARSTQLEPQSVAAGGAHASMHVRRPLVASTPHTGVVTSHAVAQSPQLVELASDASQPVPTAPSQSA